MIKKVVSAWYVHKSNLQELLDSLTPEEASIVEDKIEFYDALVGKPYTVIKFDKKSHDVSFIYSSDWDTANEPTIDISYTIKPDDKIVTRRNGNQVYHNKWQFVAPNYSGFDVEKAKQRTKDWNAIPNINSIKKYIGNKKYWHDLLNQYGLEI